MGTRAVVAEALVGEAANVDKAVRVLCDAAAKGDIAAAKALIPWLNQALGMPTERVEHRVPTGLEDLEFMSTQELERIVAQGRAQRLQREREARKQEDDDDGPDWRARAGAASCRVRACLGRDDLELTTTPAKPTIGVASL
jgi:hypothetical protein